MHKIFFSILALAIARFIIPTVVPAIICTVMPRLNHFSEGFSTRWGCAYPLSTLFCIIVFSFAASTGNFSICITWPNSPYCAISPTINTRQPIHRTGLSRCYADHGNQHHHSDHATHNLAKLHFLHDKVSFSIEWYFPKHTYLTLSRLSHIKLVSSLNRSCCLSHGLPPWPLGCWRSPTGGSTGPCSHW